MLLRPAFRALYPEFNSASDALVDAKLAETAKEVDSDLFADHTDTAHGLLTAHRISIAPNGQFARLVSKEGKTIYGEQFDTIAFAVGCGLRTF